MSAKIAYLSISKTCSKCKEEKPLQTGFYTDGSYANYSSQCRSCIIKSKKDLYQKNKLKIRATQKRCHENKRLDPDYYVRNKIRQLRYKSKILKLPFDLTIKDIFIPEFCPALGIKLEFNTGQADWNSASVDRIIPEKGYVKGNVIVVSNLANTIKSVATIEQLKAVSDFYCRFKGDR